MLSFVGLGSVPHRADWGTGVHSGASDSQGFSLSMHRMSSSAAAQAQKVSV